MKRIVITGATGTIGHALIEKCIAQEDEVYVICRKNSKRKETLRSYEDKIHIILLDLEELITAEKFIEKKCDIFYHFAWDGTTGSSRDDMYLQNKNIKYTLDAAELARRLGCSVFIGAGSQAEYGRSNKPLSEKTPVFPENGYGMAKLCAGMMSRVKCKQYGIRHIWARILSVYGPYDGENSMIMSAIRKLDSRKSAEFTAGEQLWDYIYSKDAADILYLLPDKGRDESVYCIGSGQVRTLAEYIDVLRKTVGADAGMVRMGAVPYSEKQVMYLQADTTAIATDLGYTCKYTFEEGIKETVQWYRGRIDEEN